MTITEEARKEMAWHIKTSRLIGAALIAEAERSAPHAAEMLKASQADKRAEALRLIEAAQAHCADWIAESLQAKSMTEEEAAETRQAVADMAEELRQQAERLPSGKGEQ